MMSSDSSRGTHVFIWATGQDDNIGDSLLRRPAIADARRRSSVLNVFHGASTATFDSGLGLQKSDISHRSFRTWVLRAWLSGFRKRTLIIPNAGEVRVSRRGALRILCIWAASLTPNARVMWIGAGVPGDRSVWSIPYRLLAQRAKIAAFRDAESVKLLRHGTVSPDWAFALGADVDSWASSEDRHNLAFVMRGDRLPPSDEWIAWAKDLADRLSLAPIVVAQVRRDNDLAAKLAHQLDGEAFLFGERTGHALQEARVREIYNRSRVVIGDRLHGLIVAATEGAVPMGWVESSSGKISRHFDAVHLPFVGEREGISVGDLAPVTTEQLGEWELILRRQIVDTRGRIESTLVDADLLAPRSRPKR